MLTVSRRQLGHKEAGVAAVLVATLFWSFGGVLAKSARADGVVVTFWRMWVATGVLAVIGIVRRELPTLAELKHTAVAGVLFGANIAVFFSALERVTVANALVIAALAPVLMLPIAVRILGERLTVAKVLCATLAVAGVVVSVLAAPAEESDKSEPVTGSLMAAAALVLWVGYLVLSKRARVTVDTVPFMCSVSFIAAISISAYVLVQRPDLGQIEGEGWWWIVLLAIGPGIAGHGLVAWSQQRVDASVSTVLMQAEPVGASIAAYFLLDETMSAVQALAMGVVIVALCLLVYDEAREVHEVLTTPNARDAYDCQHTMSGTETSHLRAGRRIVFTPSGRTGVVESYRTVLDVALEWGVDLDTVCGGRGICGRCEVVPVFGTFPAWDITADPTTLFARNAVERSFDSRSGLVPGGRLGCQLRITADCVIDVPVSADAG